MINAMMSQLIIYAIIASLFLEAEVFSFILFDTRIRIVQIMGVIALLYALILVVLRRMTIKTTSIDLHLWGYIAVNIVSIYYAHWMSRGVKISLLLFSLVLLYYAVTMLLSINNNFNKSFKFLIIVGILEVSYGIYQVIAGMMNSQYGFHLPVGYLGIIHSDFIGSIWGRPYGTFVEPDWYGTICMYFSLVLMALYYSKSENNKLYYGLGIFLCMTGLFFSFVRSAWLGFLAGAIFMLLYRYKSKISNIHVMLYVKKVIFLVVLLAAAIYFIKPLRTIMVQRFFTHYSGAAVSFENVRAKQMVISFKAFINSPIIGNGPGSGAFNYSSGGIDNLNGYYVGGEEEIKDDKGFNPSILLTVLEDTGFIGFFIFISLLYQIAKINKQGMLLIRNAYSMKVFGLYAGLVGVFVSYLLNQGMWIPFTWVFVAFNIVAIRKGLKADVENDCKGGNDG